MLNCRSNLKWAKSKLSHSVSTADLACLPQWRGWQMDTSCLRCIFPHRKYHHCSPPPATSELSSPVIVKSMNDHKHITDIEIRSGTLRHSLMASVKEQCFCVEGIQRTVNKDDPWILVQQSLKSVQQSLKSVQQSLMSVQESLMSWKQIYESCLLGVWNKLDVGPKISMSWKWVWRHSWRWMSVLKSLMSWKWVKRHSWR